MTPADRAALAAMLRQEADACRDFADPCRKNGSDDAADASYRKAASKAAAAAELERPRPRVEWLEVWSAPVMVRPRIVGMRSPICVPISMDVAASYALDLTAAGFDVDPLPEASNA